MRRRNPWASVVALLSLTVFYACGEAEREWGSDATVPLEDAGAVDAATLEAGRLDPSWRGPADRDLRARGGRLPTHGEATGSSAAGTLPDTAAAESYEDITPAATNAPPRLPVGADDEGPSVLRIQVLLDRALFSPGVIDGRWGKNTEKAVYWFQHDQGLKATGTVDSVTYAKLASRAGIAPPVRVHTVAEDDVAGPFVTIPDDVYEQAELDCLCYSSRLEALAERFHATPELLEKLNPDRDLESLAPGDRLQVPNVREELEPEPAKGVARIVISKEGAYTHALDADGAILYHFPSTLGSQYDPSPDGRLKITAIEYDPHFHYQPELFHEVPDEEPTAMLPSGPNSPVGVVWMQLSEPHYGIHGTSEPRTIGYTSSHGCVRLTNWDARFLARRTAVGTPVEFR